MWRSELLAQHVLRHYPFVRSAVSLKALLSSMWPLPVWKRILGSLRLNHFPILWHQWHSLDCSLLWVLHHYPFSVPQPQTAMKELGFRGPYVGKKPYSMNMSMKKGKSPLFPLSSHPASLNFSFVGQRITSVLMLPGTLRRHCNCQGDAENSGLALLLISQVTLGCNRGNQRCSPQGYPEN